MVTVIKKGDSKGEIEKKLKKMKITSKKAFEAHRFCGMMKSDRDAVAIQRGLRNEWD